MPQLDLITIYSQLSWFYTFFILGLIFLNLITLPSLSNLIKFRINLLNK